MFITHIHDKAIIIIHFFTTESCSRHTDLNAPQGIFGTTTSKYYPNERCSWKIELPRFQVGLCTIITSSLSVSTCVSPSPILPLLSPPSLYLSVCLSLSFSLSLPPLSLISLYKVMSVHSECGCISSDSISRVPLIFVMTGWRSTTEVTYMHHW